MDQTTEPLEQKLSTMQKMKRGAGRIVRDYWDLGVIAGSAFIIDPDIQDGFTYALTYWLPTLAGAAQESVSQYRNARQAQDGYIKSVAKGLAGGVCRLGRNVAVHTLFVGDTEPLAQTIKGMYATMGEMARFFLYEETRNRGELRKRLQEQRQ
ncbi:hypothetical protein JXB02_05580 [Candidatus Woesearchaeota archaeon]|nr:hypothetical protein [Candidatus Woesearchaeota archaeon]